MSADIRAAAIDVLSPLVGRAMATIYVAQATLDRGKSAETLTADDVGWLCDAIRREMRPFATDEVLDDAVAQITAHARP